jgi:hypothetical protein
MEDKMAAQSHTTKSPTRLDRAIIASVIAMVAMNIVVLAQAVSPAPAFADASYTELELA